MDLKKSNIILYDTVIRKALERLSEMGENLTLFIIDNNESLIGVLTDGDIRRGLVRGISLEGFVTEIMNKTFFSIKEEKLSYKSIKKLKESSAKIIPVTDDLNRIIRFINLEKIRDVLPLDVVILAGGRGTRLMPLTKDIPKPMLEVSGTPILEHNIDLLIRYGVTTVNISVNHLKDKIKEYFLNGSKKDIEISYIEENQPLGTLGSINLIKDSKYSDLLIINSDILTNIDLTDFFISFKESKAEMSIATTSYNVNVPYAVLETVNGKVTSMKEKPSYTYFSNAGIYLIKKRLLKEIPKGQFYNATDLIDKLINERRLVITYLILGYWLDIGKHEDYIKANQDFRHIKFK